MYEKIVFKHSLSSQGFTLIEVMIALLVFSIGIIGASTMQGMSIWGNSKASNIIESVTWSMDNFETLVSAGFNADSLTDVNGNGTNKDMNADGVDDTGNNFGLDDIPGDTTINTPDGLYTLDVNIAVDFPVEGLKSVRVFVTRNDWGQEHITSMTYIRADKI